MIDLPEWLDAVVLGIVEGLTEFIPVSSTGHLIVAEKILGFSDPGEVFTVVIQLGAILAVCAMYRIRLWRAVVGAVTNPVERRFATAVVLGCLPAAVICLSANKWLEKHVFTDAVVLPVIAGTLLVGGIAILVIERLGIVPRHREVTALPWTTALGVGFCQLLSLLPGVSRSGSTIIGGLCLGIDRKTATEFSFFLAIPVMCGASLLKLVSHADAITSDRLGTIAIGFVVSFVVAWLVIGWLVRYVANRDFTWFAWYRIVAGLAIGGLWWLST